MTRLATTSTGNGGKSEDRKVLGVTKDGVRILNSGPATHFTRKEIRLSIQKVIAARKVG